MRILVYPDFHGQLPAFAPQEAGLRLAPGDFCSDRVKEHMFASIQAWKDGGRKQWWFDRIGKEQAKQEVERSLRDGRAVLEEMDRRGLTYAVPGNWDWTRQQAEDAGIPWEFLHRDRYPELLRGLGQIRDCHLQLADAGHVQIIGYGVNSHPEADQDPAEQARAPPRRVREREERYQAYREAVDALFRKATKPVVFLAHNQPFGTPMDTVADPASPRQGMHVGSLVVRDMILRHHPLLFVGGHLHETAGVRKLGKTVCVNAGLGPNRHVLVDIEGTTVKHTHVVSA